MNLIDRAMSHETENMKSDAPTDAAVPESNATRTPEEEMQAATARIAELAAELAEMKDRWIRSEAETANVRARAHREVNETRQYAVQKFAQDVVEAVRPFAQGILVSGARADLVFPVITRTLVPAQNR